MPTTTSTIDRPDGLKLYTKKWLPEGEVRGTMQIVHGRAEYVDRYDEVAADLNAAGYAVYGSDHRGHGKTAADPSELGHLKEGDWLRIVEDLKAVHDAAAADHGDVPHFIFGHSMGSFLVQSFLWSYPGVVDGAVLQGSDSGANPLISLVVGLSTAKSALRGAEKHDGLLKAIEDVLFGLKSKPKRTNFDWINSDPARVDAYIADPMAGYLITNGLWLELGRGQKRNARAANVDRLPKTLPLLITCGELCPVSDYGKGVERLRKLYEKAGLQRVETKVYAGMRHEIHNEPRRAEVISDLTAWLDRQVEAAREQKSAA